MSKNYNIPNKIKQPAQCCTFCGKSYKSKKNLDNHIILCDFLHKSNKKNSREEAEIELQLPSQQKMYKLLLELGRKYNKLNDKVEEINKFVVKKKKKINVLEWLNASIIPRFIFDNLIEKIIVIEDDILFLINNSFIDTLNKIFKRCSIYNNNDISNDDQIPIVTFLEKSNIFYIFNKITTNIDNKTEIDNSEKWVELSKDQIIKFLNKIHHKISKTFYIWKKKNNEQIRENDNFSITSDKTLVKLMSINFNQETIYNKIKSIMYNNMKKNIKALVEYEFEF